jgi:hypothetical protein
LRLALAAAFLLAAATAHAQSSADSFADGENGAKVDKASGFVCPARIGMFERDAVGDADPETNTDFCAYSAFGGVYGTIRLIPLKGPYDPKASLAADFAEQEGTGGKEISEETETMPGAAKLAVYTRTYETAKLEDLHYRALFTGAAFKDWALEATVEYADPRDTPVEQEFLDAVYAEAQSRLGGPQN